MAALRTTLAAAVACSLAIAACGGGGASPPGKSKHSLKNPQLALARCMRSHGVPNFPDPTVGPGGQQGMSVTMSPGSSTVTVEGVALSGPQFETAKRICKLFGGQSGPPPISAAQKQQLVHFAECMRRHGIKGFADPTFPASGGVERVPNPGVNRSSPEFQKAVKVCNAAR
jgi:hypothetical protein